MLRGRKHPTVAKGLYTAKKCGDWADCDFVATWSSFMLEFQVFHGWGDKLEIFTGRPGVSEGRCLSSNSEWELFDDIAGLGICHVTVARS